MAHQFIVRIGAFDWFAKGADNPAIGDMQLNTAPCFGRTEVGGTDLGNWMSGLTIAEKGFIPIDAVAVLAQEKIGLLDAARQSHMTSQHFVEPSSAGAAYAHSDAVWYLAQLILYMSHQKMKSNLEQDVVALDLDNETGQLHRWVVDVTSSCKIVFPSMPGAYDPGAINFTLAKWTALMQTAIVYRVILAVGMEQRDGTATGVNYLATPFGNVPAPRGFDKLRQTCLLLRWCILH